MTNPLLTIDQVADYLAISRATVYRLQREDGFPPPVHVGHRRRWRKEAIDQYLERPYTTQLPAHLHYHVHGNQPHE